MLVLYENVQRPSIVKAYNHSMGGVDVLDQMISYYRIYIRSRKWTIRVIMHFVDFALALAWMEYRADCKKENIPTKDIMQLLEFRIRVASGIIYSKKN